MDGVDKEGEGAASFLAGTEGEVFEGMVAAEGDALEGAAAGEVEVAGGAGMLDDDGEGLALGLGRDPIFVASPVLLVALLPCPS